MSSKKKPNLMWDLLEPQLKAADARADTEVAPEPGRAEVPARQPRKGPGVPTKTAGGVPPVAAAPSTPPAGIPTFQSEHVATVGNQLLDLRGFDNFRKSILLPKGKQIREFYWPDILATPYAKPGSLLNSMTFEVVPVADHRRRFFRFQTRTEYGVQIYVEAVDDGS